jgi:hypothetical protein
MQPPLRAMGAPQAGHSLPGKPVVSTCPSRLPSR